MKVPFTPPTRPQREAYELSWNSELSALAALLAEPIIFQARVGFNESGLGLLYTIAEWST